MDSCNRRLARTRLLTLLAFEVVVWATRRLFLEVLLQNLQLSEAPLVQVMIILVFQVFPALVIQTSATWVILNGHQLRPKNRFET
jgi:hypothetical protein